METILVIKSTLAPKYFFFIHTHNISIHAYCLIIVECTLSVYWWQSIDNFQVVDGDDTA